uniref:WGR domain-containing protein n=1 Tax=viral metagenome TaxID=1070528 RepID=A0A6C0DAL8_9ZZZZ
MAINSKKILIFINYNIQLPIIMKTELEHINNSKVWSIELNNDSIIIQFGKKGYKLQTKKITFSSVDVAKDEYHKRINEKNRNGYKENFNSQPIEMINPILKSLVELAHEYCDWYDEESIYVDFSSIEEKVIKLQNENPLHFLKSGIIEKTITITLKNTLLKLINNFAEKRPIDYHPNTDKKVRDIVHPSIYPLILDTKLSNKTIDFWKRPYEDSKFQWLPSEFKIDSNGKCTIESYINNLPVTETELYKTIANAFEFVLPYFENIWSYTNVLELYDGDHNNYSDKTYKHISLRNKNLQVITKIVRVKLKAQEVLEGAWHVEGMSHENIVAAASITLDQGANFDAELAFKRIYTSDEAEHLLYNVPQNPSSEIDKFLNSFHVPLGKVKINNGSVILFPNSHIHRVDMKNNGTKEQSRTILVFWLVNPDFKIKSTKDIIQQNYDINKAYENRLELMKERTFYKQTFNQRDLNLCEH